MDCKNLNDCLCNLSHKYKDRLNNLVKDVALELKEYFDKNNISFVEKQPTGGFASSPEWKLAISRIEELFDANLAYQFAFVWFDMHLSNKRET